LTLLRPILASSLMLFLTACAPGRFADLKDTARLSIGGGLGLSLDAQLGALSHPSFGLNASEAGFGLDSRESDVCFYVARVSFPQSIAAARADGAGILEALNSTGWRVSYKVTSVQRGLEEVDTPLDRIPPAEFQQTINGHTYGGDERTGHWLPIPGPNDVGPYFTFHSLTDFNVGGMVGPFSARVGINPLEFVDFLLGFAGLDIAGDDPED